MLSNKRPRTDGENTDGLVEALCASLAAAPDGGAAAPPPPQQEHHQLADHVTVSFPGGGGGGGGGGALRVTVASTTTLLGVPPDVYVPVAARRVAVSDFLYRRFVDVVSPATSPWAVLVPPTTQHGQDQYILERSGISVSAANNGTVAIDVLLANINGSSGSSSSDDMRAAARVFVVTTLPALVHRWLAASQLTAPAATQHWQCAEDQEALRALLADRGGVAFVANGAILPRAGGNDDRALASAVPFEAPPTLAVEVTLPHRGRVVGMLVPRGVTVVTGGGYHGKSTLLRAVAVGSYNKVPGDGREYVVTAARSVGIRSEDGRFVSGVDVSPFIDNLPGAAGIDPRNFSTASASGSTSMAANVVEALELQPALFLLDEDTCASNFMVRDSRMRSMIANEPITPFIYRVNALYKQKGVSSIVVIGGCGDWFDVQDVTVMMDNYRCLDMSKKARSISKTFCTGRVEFNGRGLVHQLMWPEEEDDGEGDEGGGTRRRNGPRHLQALTLPTPGLRITAADDGHSVTFSGGDEGCGSVCVDLSKMEQRVASKAGALGVGIGVAFVAATVASEAGGHTPVLTLLERFERVRRRWHGGDTESTEADLQVLQDVHRHAAGGQPFVWPRAFEVAAAINRARTARFASHS